MKKKPTNWRTLLNRWISGEADRNDERSLEALAQDDPFLADALEGYRSVPGADHARSVTKLKANLRKRHGKKDRAIVFYLKRIAAVGVVLLGAWLVFRSFGPADEKAMAFDERAEASQNETAITETDPVDAEMGDGSFTINAKEVEQLGNSATRLLNDAVAEVDKDAPPAVKPLPPAKLKQDKIAQTKAKDRPSADAEKAKKRLEEEAKEKWAIVSNGPEAKRSAPISDPAPLADEVRVEATQSAPAAKREQAAQPGSVAPAPELADGAVYYEQKEIAVADVVPNAPFTIIGKVTDTRDEPLIGANVLIKNTSQGVVTDINGSFAIGSDSEHPTLVVSYTGYETHQLEAKSGQTVKVRLEEGPGQLSEVVVTKRNDGLFKKKSSTVEQVQFKPQGGMGKFEKYIKENLRMPQAAMDAGIKGEVEISFTIDGAGNPTGFETLRPLGHGCDEEAMRLLTEGPKWSGQPGIRHSYTFKF